MLQFKHCKIPKSQKHDVKQDNILLKSQPELLVASRLTLTPPLPFLLSVSGASNGAADPLPGRPLGWPPPPLTLLRWPTPRCELLSPWLIEPPDHFYSPHPSLFMTLQFDYSERGVWSGESPGEGSHTNTHQSSYERNVDICCLFYHPVPALICLIIKDWPGKGGKEGTLRRPNKLSPTLS